jgi:hypothetical protein
LLAEVRSSSNSSEQLLSICASSAKSESTVVFVSSSASSGHVRFIDRTPESPAIDGFFLGSCESLFPSEKPPLLHLGFLRVLRFPVRAGPPSLSPHLPRWRRPSPSVSPHGVVPSPPRGGDGSARPRPMRALRAPNPWPRQRSAPWWRSARPRPPLA